MSGPDYLQDDQPGTPSKVPSLIHDYRAQRDAWREQARNLARMREEVLAAADHEAKDIVSAARADIRRILLKARRDLLVLAAQVRAAGRLGDPDDPPEAVNFLPTDDLGQAQNVLTSARHDVRRVLDESRPELEGLAAEGEALRAALRQQRPIGPVPVEKRQQIATPVIPDTDTIDAEPARPVDFEFASLAADEPPDLVVNGSRLQPMRALLTVAASVGALALMGTALWLYRPQDPPKVIQATAESKSTSSGRPKPVSPATKTGGSATVALTSNTSANAVRTPNSEPHSPVSGQRGALSIQLGMRRASWLRVTVDGRVTAERTFKPGETQQITAAREISVRAGDAGAVMVGVDGREPAAFGREGEALTRRFAVEPARSQSTAPPVAQRVTPSPSVPIAQGVPARPTPPSNATALSTTPPSVSTPIPTPRPANPPPAVVTPPTNSATLAAAPAKPPTASVDRPVAAAPAAAAVSTQQSLQESLTNQASRWHDAYYRQDRAMLSSIAPQTNVSDDRQTKERLPAGLNGVRRSLEDVSVRVFGSSAMLTARMTERMDNAAAGQMAQAVSFISHMWTQKNGTWQLEEVRIVSASALSRSLNR